MCFVFIWEQTATCVTYSINWLVFITEMKSVYCAVRTRSLNKAVCSSYLKAKQADGPVLLRFLLPADCLRTCMYCRIFTEQIHRAKYRLYSLRTVLNHCRLSWRLNVFNGTLLDIPRLCLCGLVYTWVQLTDIMILCI
jgi:hypothetical protein